MKKSLTIIVTIIFLFSGTIQAGIVQEVDPIEDELILSEKLSIKAEKESNKKPGWLKWVLGAVLIGGIAAAAGGSGGEGGGGGDDDNGSATVSW